MTKCSPLKLTLLICFLVLSQALLVAQNKTTITGVVVGSDSKPIIGVTVAEPGTSNGTTTNAKGEYSISVSKGPNTFILFSYMGMVSVTEKIGNRIKINVTLSEDQNLLDDVVVIGYGTAKKSDVTGSVASVSAATFKDKMITSIEDALRGQVAGVRILSNSGEPGESLNIRIRGSGSLNASNAPIYVIDGIVSEEANISAGDIQSMEFLKDASATAIYGSKGANGVVMITTKRGAKGATKVSISANYSVQSPVRLIEMMDSQEYSAFRNSNNYIFHKWNSDFDYGASTNQVYKDSEGNYYEYVTGTKWSEPAFTDPNNPDFINTDWQQAMLRQVLTQDYRLNVSGGDENSNFAVMGGFFTQPGALIHSDFKRYTLRSNYERSLNKKGSKFSINLSGTQSENSGLNTATGGVTMQMLQQAPTKKKSAEDWEPDGGGENQYENNNPIYQAAKIKQDTYKSNYQLRMAFDIVLLKSLKMKVAGNFESSDLRNENYFPKDVSAGRQEGGKAINKKTSGFGWNSENLLYWTPTLKNKNHKFDMMGGVILDKSTRKMLSTQVNGFALEDITTGGMQEGTNLYNITTDYVTNTMLSYLGRAQYNYKGKYLFTGSIRFDGSSRFGDDSKWGVFPSGAFAWRASEEPWLKSSKVISNLKLRTSVGKTGNSSIPSLQSLELLNKNFYPEDGSNPSYGVVVARPGNQYLRWETSIQYDAGVDFGFFNNRLSGTIDLYRKETKDLLFEQPIPYSTGYAFIWSNIAKLRNNGMELSINAVPIPSKNSFSWNVSYNMSFNRSKILDMGGASELILNPGSASGSSNFAILRVGESLGSWFGYKTDGLYRSQSEIDALPDNYSSAGITKDALRPGYTKFVDTNNDGTVDEKDREILGGSEPKFTGGLQNSVTWHNFTFTLGLEFSYGGKIFNATARDLSQLNSNNARNNMAKFKNYWIPDLYDVTTGEMVRKGREGSDVKTNYRAQWENVLTDRFLEDASYLRIDNVSLSYQIPQAITRKVKIDTFSVFFGVRNAYVFTNYTGYDPDVSVAKGVYGDLVPRLDSGSFPRTISYTFGANLTF